MSICGSKTLTRARFAQFAGLLALVGVLAIPSQAAAKPGLTTGVADFHLQALDDSTRGYWWDRTAEANTGIVRVGVAWDYVASRRPANPADPGDPAYDFRPVDAAVRSAAQRGIDVVINVCCAPGWAEGPGRPEGTFPGTWKPDAEAFGDLATALATRYSGTYSGASTGGTLPRVDQYEVWNEPNLLLAPLWDGKKPYAPTLYRGLLNAFYDAVNRVDPGITVIGPGTSPYGEEPGGARMRPVTFLRELFCLEERKGKLRPQSSCPGGPPKLDVLSHHPISTSGNPTRSAVHRLDAATPDLDRVESVVRAAEKHGLALPANERRPLWATEFWWISDPPDRDYGVPLAKQARWLQESLYIFWRDDARVAINWLLQDLENGPDGFGQFGSGLFLADDQAKPAFQAFRFPFVTDRSSSKKVKAWGIAPQTGKLRIERDQGSRWKRVEQLNVDAGEVFTAGIKARGATRFRARVNGESSLVWRQSG